MQVAIVGKRRQFKRRRLKRRKTNRRFCTLVSR